MTMKVQKTLSLEEDVARRLSEEENMSRTVEGLLREYYNMEDG